MNTAVSTCETQAEGESVMGRTLAEKIWDAHVVRSAAGEPDLLYIDLHLLHEVTSPQAFDRSEGESVMGRTLAEKIWDAHVVRSAAGEPDLLYIDLHLLHEVTSPQAFD